MHLLIRKIKFSINFKRKIWNFIENVYYIKNLDDLKRNYKFVKKPILQECIGSKADDEKIEYTCSFLKQNQKKFLGQ